MNIRSFIPTVLSLLGISKFHEEQGKQQLLESQRAAFAHGL